MTGKRRVNRLYGFEWMARKVETDIRCKSKRLRGEADGVSTTVVQTWIERLPELYHD